MALSSPAFAGGDQNNGGTGTGKGSQKTYENGCGSQPCSLLNAEQPVFYSGGLVDFKKPLRNA